MAWTIVVAAGRGTRFGGLKPYAPLCGRRVLDWSLAAARSVTDGVVLVVVPERVEEGHAHAAHTVAGGATRSQSVRAGLAVVPASCATVLVHDAARPLAATDLFERVVAAVEAGADGAVPSVPVIDTLRRVDGGVVDRHGLVAVQTPQAFRADQLRAAHAPGGDATDDAALLEAAGGRVVLVPGDPANLKITGPTDLVVAAALLEARAHESSQR